jgi:hypothetical protein
MNPNPREIKGMEKGLPTWGPAIPSSPPIVFMTGAREGPEPSEVAATPLHAIFRDREKGHCRKTVRR